MEISRFKVQSVPDSLIRRRLKSGLSVFLIMITYDFVLYLTTLPRLRMFHSIECNNDSETVNSVESFRKRWWPILKYH
jgi:hypothetical protein